MKNPKANDIVLQLMETYNAIDPFRDHYPEF